MDSAAVALRRTQVKLGASSVILGALLGLVVNLMHGDLPADEGITNWGR
jgi:hypothetical protein